MFFDQPSSCFFSSSEALFAFFLFVLVVHGAYLLPDFVFIGRHFLQDIYAIKHLFLKVLVTFQVISSLGLFKTIIVMRWLYSNSIISAEVFSYHELANSRVLDLSISWFNGVNQSVWSLMHSIYISATSDRKVRSAWWTRTSGTWSLVWEWSRISVSKEFVAILLFSYRLHIIA